MDKNKLKVPNLEYRPNGEVSISLNNMGRFTYFQKMSQFMNQMNGMNPYHQMNPMQAMNPMNQMYLHNPKMTYSHPTGLATGMAYAPMPMVPPFGHTRNLTQYSPYFQF